MSLSVPYYTSLSVLALQWVNINSILLHDLEKGLVSAKTDTPKLVVIPLLVEDIFDVGELIASESDSVEFSTVFADKNSKPDDGMRGSILFAVNAVLVVRVGELLL